MSELVVTVYIYRHCVCCSNRQYFIYSLCTFPVSHSPCTTFILSDI